jgi:RNA 2',3'-cyclic 3'-phosphodiesterase
VSAKARPSPVPRGEGERVRLFVALELPDDVRDALVRWRERLAPVRGGELRPVAPEALHVTLCFLGWGSEDEIDGISAACNVVAAQPAPPLALDGAVWLPPRRPRVLAVELDDPEQKLAQAQATLSSALAAGGWYVPEKRPFLAHVTVARVRTRISGRELPELPRLKFRAARVVLYRSRLYSSSARYEALASVELASTA